MTAARNPAVTAVYLFLRQDGRVLVMRRCNTGYEDGNYHVPAGHVDAGERPTDAMVREAREEIGIDLAPDDIELVRVLFRTKRDETGDRVDFFFQASRWGGSVTNMEPGKCDDLRWVTPEEWPENATAYVRAAFASAERGKIFSEF